jgi:hypothetical protein
MTGVTPYDILLNEVLQKITVDPENWKLQKQKQEYKILQSTYYAIHQECKLETQIEEVMKNIPKFRWSIDHLKKDTELWGGEEEWYERMISWAKNGIDDAITKYDPSKDPNPAAWFRNIVRVIAKGIKTNDAFITPDVTPGTQPTWLFDTLLYKFVNPFCKKYLGVSVETFHAGYQVCAGLRISCIASQFLAEFTK